MSKVWSTWPGMDYLEWHLSWSVPKPPGPVGLDLLNYIKLKSSLKIFKGSSRTLYRFGVYKFFDT